MAADHCGEIHPPPEVFATLYPAIGSLVVNWALLEQSMEHWVEMIYRHPGGNEGYKKRFPFQFSAKHKYLVDKFKTLPDLAPFTDEALSLIERIDRLADIRDIFVHGAISTYQAETQFLTFRRLRVDKGTKTHNAEDEQASIPEIVEAGGHILHLWTRSLDFTKRLAKHFEALTQPGCSN